MTDELRTLSDEQLELEVLRAIAVLAEQGRRIEQKRDDLAQRRNAAAETVNFTATPLPGAMSARP